MTALRPHSNTPAPLTTSQPSLRSEAPDGNNSGLQTGSRFWPKWSGKWGNVTLNGLLRIVAGGAIGGIAGTASGAGTGLASFIYPMTFKLCTEQPVSAAVRFTGQAGLVLGSLGGAYVGLDPEKRAHLAHGLWLAPAIGLCGGVVTSSAGALGWVTAYVVGVDESATLTSIAQKTAIAAVPVLAAVSAALSWQHISHLRKLDQD